MAHIRIVKWYDPNTVCWEGEATDMRAALQQALVSRAVLTDADLTGAVLRDADLTAIRDDLWAVLSAAPAEVSALLVAVREGRIDGSCYHGECACLVGTIANARHCDLDKLGTLRPNSARPAERFFLGISEGDTPATNQAAALIEQWIVEWLTAMRAAFGPEVTHAR